MTKLKITCRTKAIAWFCLLIALACSPIWAVRYFVNGDGSGHLYTSFVMLRLLRGDVFFTDVFAFNSLAVPNSSGHWLMAGLLAIFSPIIVTKIIVTLSFVVFAAAIVHLRCRTGGGDIFVSILFATAIAFNWLWMQGSYNYMFGVAGSTLTLSLFFSWRDHMSISRTVVLAALLAFVFVSHLVSFVILAGSLFLLAAFAERKNARRALASVCAALAPCIPLLISYRMISRSGEPFVPAWRSLANAASPASWIVQIFYADPFALISRRTLPFYTESSALFFLLAPVVWIAVSAFIMMLATLLNARSEPIDLRRRLPFALLSAACALAAFFGPDDFGITNGSILRERMLIAALIFFVPVFNLKGRTILKNAARASLIFVVIFQSAAFWDYSIAASRATSDFMAARQSIPENVSIASVGFVDDALRYHASPTAQAVNYLGVNKDVIVWDNYELGHYLFPVVTRRPADKDFVYGLSGSNVLYSNYSKDEAERKIENLDAILTQNHDKIDFLVTYGDERMFSRVVGKWYDRTPIFESGGVRVLKRLAE